MRIKGGIAYDRKTFEELIKKGCQLCAEEIQKQEYPPILRGRDIKRYSYEFADLWLICIPCGFTNSKSYDAVDKEKWFKEKYNAIYEFLVSSEERLSKTRSSSSKGLYKRDDQGDYWWDLRSCIYMVELTQQI